MKNVPLLQALLKARPDRTKDELLAFIVCRNVYVDGELLADPKQVVAEDALFEIRTRTYVSRGGYKLEHALSSFRIDASGEIFLDAGSSTGGF
ncbi:MAG: TlyA family RNA methyltransferase, partial [Spirochaetales bacterium]|nr:TlyA family RNA methyltransferase [Spirochaetales bacterium]